MRTESVRSSSPGGDPHPATSLALYCQTLTTVVQTLETKAKHTLKAVIAYNSPNALLRP